MRMLLVAAALAAAGYFFYSRSHAAPEPAPASTRDTTPGADAKNRVDNLSGSVDDEP